MSKYGVFKGAESSVDEIFDRSPTGWGGEGEKIKSI